jgi:signal transduction histidine kinase/integral membrane sensor domain MASE1
MRANHSLVARIAWIATVAVLYFAAAKLCIELPTREGALTAIWVPSGVAVAAVLIGGPWMLVGVFLGDVAISLDGDFSPAISAWFALGDSAEAWIATTLLVRVTRPARFRRPLEVFVLVPVVAIACAVSATNGTLVLVQQGLLDGSWQDQWLLYWSSTATGVILTAPAILAWRRSDDIARSFLRQAHPWRVAAEAVTLLGLLVLVCTQVFLRVDWELLGLFLIFPLFTWATVRFGQHGATTSVLVVAAFGVWGTTRNSLLIAGLDDSEIAQVLQLLLAVVLLANLVLAVVLHERDHARANVEELLSVFGHSLRLANVGSWQLRLRPRDWQPGDELLDIDDAPANGTVPASTLPEIAAALGPSHTDEGAVRLWYSPELSRILGLPDDDQRHRPLTTMLAIVQPEDRARVVRAVRNAIAGGGIYSIEHGIRRPSDGARRVLRHVGTVVDRDDPEGGRIVGSILDITDQREVELLKDSLVATASHELRTPLTSVLGFAATLGRSWDEIPDHERRRYLHIIEEQANRLVMIVDDTLEQAKLDSSSLVVDAQPIQASSAFVTTLRELPDARDVTIEGDCDELVLADPRHLDRILTNLLNNAQKYGRPPIVLDCRRLVTPEHPRGAIALRVTDHGRGVSPDFEARMFDRFTRGPDTVHAQGTGLGLSIVRGLAQAMGGDIRYVREDGATTFEVVLPAADPGPNVPAESKRGNEQLDPA